MAVKPASSTLNTSLNILSQLVHDFYSRTCHKTATGSSHDVNESKTQVSNTVTVFRILLQLILSMSICLLYCTISHILADCAIAPRFPAAVNFFLIHICSRSQLKAINCITEWHHRMTLMISLEIYNHTRFQITSVHKTVT